MPHLKQLSFWLLLAAFLAMLSIQLRFLGLGLFWDDETFLFRNPVISAGHSPLLFWTRGHPDTRAWPLYYTLMWGLVQLFGDRFFAYHLGNIFLHTMNGLLLHRIARRLALPLAFLPTCVLWLHPFSVEPVSWIFQGSKLLCTGLVLLWLLLRFEKMTAGLAALGAALLSGGQAYLFPLLELPQLKRLPPAWRFPALAAGTLLVSYFAMLIITGVGEAARHDQGVRAYLALFGQHFPGDVLSEPGVPPVSSLAVPERGLRSGLAYVQQLATGGRPGFAFGAALLVMRFGAVGLCAGYYLLRFLFPWGATLPEQLGNPGIFLFLLCVLGGLLLVVATILCLKRRAFLPSLFLLSYWPVSGFFFIPWLEISFVADRFVYLPLAVGGLALWQFLSSRLEPRKLLSNRAFQAALSLWLVFLLIASQRHAALVAEVMSRPLKTMFQVSP